jgi:hypothetical protein
LRWHVGNVFSKDDGKATRILHQVNDILNTRKYEHDQVPINVAVEEPRAWVVGEEPDRDIIIITYFTDAHDIAEDRVHEIVRGVTGAAYNGERMSMQMDGMLLGERSLARPCRQMPE